MRNKLIAGAVIVLTIIAIAVFWKKREEAFRQRKIFINYFQKTPDTASPEDVSKILGDLVKQYEAAQEKVTKMEGGEPEMPSSQKVDPNDGSTKEARTYFDKLEQYEKESADARRDRTLKNIALVEAVRAAGYWSFQVPEKYKPYLE